MQLTFFYDSCILQFGQFIYKRLWDLRERDNKKKRLVHIFIGHLNKKRKIRLMQFYKGKKRNGHGHKRNVVRTNHLSAQARQL